MSLRIARPWKDPKSGVYHLRQRTPVDLVARLKGQTVSLPIGEAWASVRIGPIVQASLRTKDPREARIRHSLADGALKRIWQGEQSGENPPSHEQGTVDSSWSDRGLTHALADVSVKPQTVPSRAKLDGPSLTVADLFERWAMDRADKRAPNTIKRYRGSFRSFDAFVAGRDVRTLTGDDVFAWAVHRRDREAVSPRAINKNDLVALSSVLKWASGRSGGQLLTENVASGVSLDELRIVAQRERTFRECEIADILSAASAVQFHDGNPTRSATRRWCPWLAAYSGARIAELTNLHLEDICTEGSIRFMRLRVTKTGEPRSVPIHAHLIEQGFLAFAEASGPGPLFYDSSRHGAQSKTPPGELQGHKLGKWVRETVKLDPAVDPNHGWRHTWKTRALGAGIEERLRDAITGHRIASVGRRYETPTLKMLAEAIDRFPRYRAETMKACSL